MVLDKNTVENDGKDDIPIVAFTSGKGGCGKTTLAVNFANVLAQTGENIMLIDLDLSNRGSTGVFSRWTRRSHQNITAARLLRNELELDSKCRDLFHVKKNLIFVPAASPDEAPWIEPDCPSLREFVAEIRNRLLELANRCGAACIVIDCFCGVDLLTTAASSIADHTLLVNEPDIITFTGTTNLIFHLQKAFQSLERKPQLHIVVNRLRYTQTVESLSALYRNNLQEIVREPVLCYFPYHPRIFENFGEYPFASDLLPKSLFVRKLKLVAWELFGASCPHLVPPTARKWSKRKLRRTYFRSIDPSAVNADYLVLKFTRFPLLLGLWFLFRLLVLGAFPLTPNAAWSLRILIEILLWIIAIPLLHGTWLAARLNFSLAALRARLSRLVRSRWEKSYHLATSFTALAAGTLMAIAMLGSFGWMASNVYLLTNRFGFGFARVGQPTSADHRRIQGLLEGEDVRILHLRQATFKNLDLSGRRFPPKSHSLTREALFGYATEILVGDQASFNNCNLDASVLLPNRNAKVTFDNCIFSRSWTSHEPLIIANRAFEGCTFSSDVFTDGVTITAATFKNCKFEGDSYKRVEIEQSKFDGCEFGSSFFEKISIKKSSLKNCEFRGTGGFYWVDNATLDEVEFSGFPNGRTIIFGESEIRNSRVELAGGTRVALLECDMGGTKIINRGPDSCLVYAPEDTGVEFDGNFERVGNEKDFLARLKPEPTLQEALQTVEEGLRKIQDKGSDSYRIAAVNLIELEILANTEASLKNAQQRLAEVESSARDAQDIPRIASSVLLNVLLAIVTSNPKDLEVAGSPYQNAYSEWKTWCASATWQQNRQRLTSRWNWQEWDRHAQKSLNRTLTIQQLKAIEEMKASAVREGLSPAPRADSTARGQE